MFFIYHYWSKISKKKRINKLFLIPKPKFNINNNKKYEVEVIKDIAVYNKKA